MGLEFKKAKQKADFEDIYNYNVEAFSDSVDIKWSREALNQHHSEGWEIYSVASEDDEIIAVLFVLLDAKKLYTKNTPIKMSHQGQGYSHEIKEFYEELAVLEGAKKVVSYCRQDNFRMISLNETHGYSKVREFEDEEENLLIEWEKTIS